ncbi:hypothetical protein HQ590_05190 [bacterium]|nr:hypothetical protein [bacterium]
MKRNATEMGRGHRPTLGELVLTVNKLTHNTRLSAAIVADMVNSQMVRLEGSFQGQRVRIG